MSICYKSNKKTRITSKLIEKLLSNFDKNMKLKGKKVLFLIDNCTARNTKKQLDFIKVEFVPSNTSSQLQSIYESITQNFKILYH